MKKRLIAAMAAMIVVSAFTGCSETNENNVSTTESAVTTTTNESTTAETTTETEVTSEEDKKEDTDKPTDIITIPASSAPMNEKVIEEADLDDTVWADLIDVLNEGSYSMNFSYKVTDEFLSEIVDYTYTTNGTVSRVDYITDEYSEIALNIDGKEYLLLPDENKYVNISEDVLNNFMAGVETGLEATTSVTDEHEGHEHSDNENMEETMFYVADPYDFLKKGTATAAVTCEIEGQEYYRVMFKTSIEGDDSQYYAYFDNDNKLAYTAVTSYNNIINLQASDITITGDIDETLLVIPENYEEISFESYMNSLMSEGLNNEAASPEDIITDAE